MARLEIVAGEAHQERRTYLTHEFDPDHWFAPSFVCVVTLS
jgi:hypothetical protein